MTHPVDLYEIIITLVDRFNNNQFDPSLIYQGVPGVVLNPHAPEALLMIDLLEPNESDSVFASVFIIPSSNGTFTYRFIIRSDSDNNIPIDFNTTDEILDHIAQVFPQPSSLELVD